MENEVKNLFYKQQCQSGYGKVYLKIF